MSLNPNNYFGRDGENLCKGFLKKEHCLSYSKHFQVVHEAGSTITWIKFREDFGFFGCCLEMRSA